MPTSIYHPPSHNLKQSQFFFVCRDAHHTRSSSFTTMLHLGSGESGVEDLQSDTQRTRWKLIGIGTRDQSLQLGFFGVSCLLACDILVKYCDRPQPYKGCGFY